MLSSSDNQHVHSLPPFANAKNKEISGQIHQKEAKLNSLLSILDDNSSRGDAMRGHLKNVQQELMHTQALHDAKTRQIETEDHFKQLADRESGRLVLEIRRTEKEIADITDHLNTIQNNIYRGNEKIESIRTELKMEKDELDEWLRVQAEKEEDNFALLKYTKEDDMRIKDFSLGIEKLMHEVNKKKAELSVEVTETQVAQIELDKTTDAFKRLHLERQDLIQQWEHAIATMAKRDSEISELQDKYQQSKQEIVDKGKIIAEKQAFLDLQVANNSEIEKKIGLVDRQVSKFRMEHNDSTENFSHFQDDVDILRSTLTKTSTDLSNRKNELTNLKDDLHRKQEALERELQNRNSMKSKLERVSSNTLSLEAKAAELQEILRNEETRNKELDREIKGLREQQFKRTQELFHLKQEEKNLSAEITGSEATLKNLSGSVH
ncbi:Coiled-coil domain-containing protein 39, partial [Physocladia obscura]